jgi:hypothetical protein
MGMKYIYKFPKDANGTEMEAMRQFFNKRYVEWEFSVINGSDLVTWGGMLPHFIRHDDDTSRHLFPSLS